MLSKEYICLPYFQWLQKSYLFKQELGLQDPQADLAPLVPQEQRVLQVLQDEMEEVKVALVQLAYLVGQEVWDHEENLVEEEFLGHKEQLDYEDHQDHQECLEVAREERVES